MGTVVLTGGHFIQKRAREAVQSTTKSESVVKSEDAASVAPGPTTVKTEESSDVPMTESAHVNMFAAWSSNDELPSGENMEEDEVDYGSDGEDWRG